MIDGRRTAFIESKTAAGQGSVRNSRAKTRGFENEGALFGRKRKNLPDSGPVEKEIMGKRKKCGDCGALGIRRRQKRRCDLQIQKQGGS